MFLLFTLLFRWVPSKSCYYSSHRIITKYMPSNGHKSVTYSIVTQAKVSYIPTIILPHSGKYSKFLQMLLNVTKVIIFLIIYLDASLYHHYNFFLWNRGRFILGSFRQLHLRNSFKAPVPFSSLQTFRHYEQ